jgi:outer membrane scaffolding protein for murein synthesis (MipA/OmpV family)
MAKVTYTSEANGPSSIWVEALILRAGIKIVCRASFACVKFTENLVLGVAVCSSERVDGDSLKRAIAAVPVRSASVDEFFAGNTILRSSAKFLAFSKSAQVAIEDPIGCSVGSFAVIYSIVCDD